jgi:hypothetical protein
MKLELIIQTIEKELIQVHSLLDGWFDEDSHLLNYHPKDGGWSAYQILEHVTLTSHYLLLLIGKGTDKSLTLAKTSYSKVDWETYSLDPDGKLFEIGIHKSFTWHRPDHMVPLEELSPGKIRKTLRRQLSDCLCFLDKLANGEGALCKITMSVNDLGKLDVYQYLYFLAQHGKRHLTQLEKNRLEFDQHDEQILLSEVQ